MNIRTFALALSLLCITPAFAVAQDTTPDVVEVVEAEDVALDAEEVVEEAPAEEASGEGEGSAEEVVVIEEVPESYDDVEEAFMALLAAGKAGNWSVFAGLLLMILVWGGRKFLFPRLKGQALAWASAGFGTVAFVGIALAAGTPIVSALVTGLMTGAMATGLWELVGRATLGRSDS